MRLSVWVRAVLATSLIAVLGVPPGAWTAHAQQQEGPTKAPPAQQSEPAKPPTGQQNGPQGQAQQAPQVSIAVESNVVNVDAVVTDNAGNIVTGLKKENFRILDNGQPQQVTNFAPTEAPITVVMLLEFSARYWGYFGYKGESWAWGFLQGLNPKDWIAFKTFDIKTEVTVDFTQNKGEIQQAISQLFVPGFHEACLFDAVLETLDQLNGVKGKKAILLLATGFDTFSKHTLDQTYKRLKEADVPIFAVGMGEDIDLRTPTGGGVSYLQAKNQLTQFGSMTGGYAWFPRFQGEMPEIFGQVAAFLRSQYSLGFAPTTPADGKFHKLKVEAVDDGGNLLQLPDKKGKMKKTIVYARNGYTPKVMAGTGGGSQ
ncbi:MAG: VWA domain-containing protein [Candidatus Acidiferrales bacterium]